MKMIFSLSLVFMILMSGCNSCKSLGSYNIYFTNNTPDTLRCFIGYNQIGNDYPDTTLPLNIPDAIDFVWPNYTYSYLPVNVGKNWADVFSRLPSDTLCVYLLSQDTLNKHPWDSIRVHYNILQRYDVSLEDMEKRNFRIEYPYDSTLGKLKVYKR